jgi:uncharacterized membrane protein
MMADTDPYMGFKKQIGYTLVVAAVLYGVLVTVLLLFFGVKMTTDDKVWGFANTIISTMLGWLIAKASTIIDNVWGTSRGSDIKTEAMIDTAKALAARVDPDEPNPTNTSPEGEVK